jgi:hypothetical protein
MAFDPAKYGATPVATSTGFDPRKYGATPVQQKSSVMPAPVQKKGLDNWASNIPVLSQIQDFGIGLGSAIGRAGMGLGEAALKVGGVGEKLLTGSDKNAQNAIMMSRYLKDEVFNKPYEQNLETMSGKGGTLTGTIAP